MERRKRSTASVRFITRGALVAALYVALSYLSSVFGLASGAIQLRVSEALCVLPLFMPEAIPGLFIGCILSNIISGCVLWDIVFGSLATLIGAVGCYAMRRLPLKIRWLATLPNIVANSVIVPLVLIYAYGVSSGYFILMLSVGIGEIICSGILGTVALYSIVKAKIK